MHDSHVGHMGTNADLYRQITTYLMRQPPMSPQQTKGQQAAQHRSAALITAPRVRHTRHLRFHSPTHPNFEALSVNLNMLTSMREWIAQSACTMAGLSVEDLEDLAIDLDGNAVYDHTTGFLKLSYVVRAKSMSRAANCALKRTRHLPPLHSLKLRTA